VLEGADPPPAAEILERERILARLRERILAYAASRLGRDLAEDLSQEVLLVLHQKYRQLERLEDLLPVSFEILRWKMVSLRRKAARRGEYGQVSVEDVPLEDGRPDPEDEAARRERVERLARALEQLGKRCRTLFRLKLEGRTFAEIREMMGAASINTVYTWDFRCRQELLERLGGSWEGL